jgi:hypothetical protein
MTLRLAYQGLEMAVDADRSADLIWLQDFLGPNFHSDQASTEKTTAAFRLCHDPAWSERREQWLEGEELSATRATVLAHVLDGSDLHLPCRQQADGSLLAWEEQFECFYLQDGSGLTSILQPETSPPARRARFALMRCVRELAMHHDRRRGALALHASGLARHSQGLLFAGPRRSGKTTLLSACLSLVKGLTLLANDRVMVNPDGPQWCCRGMATIVSVRSGDEPLLPGLRQRLHAQAFGAESGTGEAPARSFELSERLMLSPSQYCRGLGVEMGGERRLAGIALPSVVPELTGMAWRRLPGATAAAALRGALFGSTHQCSRSQLFDAPASGPYPDADEQLALLERLATDVPCWEVSLGVDAYRQDILSDMVDTLLGQDG